MTNLQLLGKEGYVQLNAKEIVKNLGGKLELDVFTESNLPVKEGIKYYSEQVQIAWEKWQSMRNEVKAIKELAKAQSWKNTKLDAEIKKLIASKTETVYAENVINQMFYNAKKLTVPVINKTTVTVSVIMNGEKDYTAHATIKQVYIDNENKEATVIEKTPIFLDKQTKGTIRITNDELSTAIPANKAKLYNAVANMLNEFDELKASNSGRFAIAQEQFNTNTTKKLNQMNRFISLLSDGTIG